MRRQHKLSARILKRLLKLCDFFVVELKPSDQPLDEIPLWGSLVTALESRYVTRLVPQLMRKLLLSHTSVYAQCFQVAGKRAHKLAAGAMTYQSTEGISVLLQKQLTH